MKVLVGFSEKDYPQVKVFSDLGKCEFINYDKNYLINRICEFDILIPNLSVQINSEIISKAQNLTLLATPSTGTDHIEIDLIKKKYIKLISLNDDRLFLEQISSTAEMAWLLVLGSMRKIRKLNNRIQIDKSWDNSDIRGFELNKKTLGIIGYGRLGKLVANYANSFGMNVLAYDINTDQYDSKVEGVFFETLLRNSDVISLHAKLTKKNINIIDELAVSKMKKGVVIVNTARGGLLKSSAILTGLDNEIISAVGLDVLNNEYNSLRLPNDPLIERSLKDDRILITPHVGGATYDSHKLVFYKLAELIKNSLNN